MLILQYKVSLLLIDLVVAFVLFIFVLAYCCVFVVTGSMPVLSTRERTTSVGCRHPPTSNLCVHANLQTLQTKAIQLTAKL